MPISKKPLVRLDSVAKTKKPKPNAPPKLSIIKLAIRLNTGVNEALRSQIRYRGDLSVMVIQALESTDLEKLALVSAEEEMVRDTTISLPRKLHKRIKEIAEARDSSMNILVNMGLAYWLATKGLITLK